MSKHVRSRGLPIDGVERPTADGWSFPARNPATGEVLWEVPDAGVSDVEVAAAAARRAFDGTQWSTDTALRADALRRLRAALVEQSDGLAALMAAETGVPVSLRATHLDAPIAGLRGAHQSEPVGVTAVLTPATSPLAVAIEEVGRVLAAGGTVVLKPAPEAASAAMELGRLALDILPRGVLNVVPTRDVDVATALLLDRRIDEVSFTGSAVAGERVQVAGERAGKRVRLDLGGALTVCADEDADVDAVVSAATATVAANAGQACRVTASVVVPARRYAEALRTAVDAMDGVVVGDPVAPETLCGPLRSPAARDRVLRYLSLARSEGGDIALGGRALDRDGWWVAPTVVGGLSRRSRLVCEEVLGPVLMVVAEG